MHSRGVWGYSPVWGQEWNPVAENGSRAFQRAIMSPQDMQLNTINFILLPKIKLNMVKPVLSSNSKWRPKLSFQDRLSLNAGQKYCRMFQSFLQYFRPSLSYHLSLISDFLSIFEWLLKTGFTVTKKNHILAASSCTHMRICVQVGTPLDTLLILGYDFISGIFQGRTKYSKRASPAIM